jgi:SH3 domain protein
MRRSALLALALCATAEAAETAYVTDSLRLGLHSAADTSDRPFENLVSGAAVEVLERNSSYARVRLTDGREGWVKATYLVTVKPAAARVLELEAEIAGLKEAAKTAQTAQAHAEHELSRLTAEHTATYGSEETVQEAVERLQTENRAYEERLIDYRYSLPVKWVLAAVAVALVAGFLLGLWWLDASIRRRHGGFRVY